MSKSPEQFNAYPYEEIENSSELGDSLFNVSELILSSEQRDSIMKKVHDLIDPPEDVSVCTHFESKDGFFDFFKENNKRLKKVEVFKEKNDFFIKQLSIINEKKGENVNP